MAALSGRAINRATLARQLLVERADVSVVAAVERLAGMQGQEAKHPYVGLWSRVQGFAEAELDRAIDEVLAEMDMPEPQIAYEDREHEHAAEVEPLEPGDDDWLREVIEEMDREDAWDRGREREPPGLELEP